MRRKNPKDERATGDTPGLRALGENQGGGAQTTCGLPDPDRNAAAILLMVVHC